MAQWGRSVDAAPGVVAKGKLGKRSVILALAAFAAGAVALATMVALPSNASALAQNIATSAFMAVFLLAAPLAHIVGLIFGLMALARSNDSRLLGVVGILLNGISLAAGILLVVAMASSIGAYT
ncbi:hypothetical protein LHFGNBLO_003735 [Mesorhizobium sp. AR10]|uniref:hypothetical protein n=1 Tax=Mesorhizobium sp. AR10 TaxID=2865839 RepID=UPI00215F3F85|nr:hypothetical protein [Mesorhizobium sp. AR10]UVK36775.1 hypothetical protein LHFGNBLO_003735 [Mesorhizobium sp. AR10]